MPPGEVPEFLDSALQHGVESRGTLSTPSTSQHVMSDSLTYADHVFTYQPGLPHANWSSVIGMIAFLGITGFIAMRRYIIPDRQRGFIFIAGCFVLALSFFGLFREIVLPLRAGGEVVIVADRVCTGHGGVDGGSFASLWFPEPQVRLVPFGPRVDAPMSRVRFACRDGTRATQVFPARTRGPSPQGSLGGLAITSQPGRDRRPRPQDARSTRASRTSDAK